MGSFTPSRRRSGGRTWAAIVEPFLPLEPAPNFELRLSGEELVVWMVDAIALWPMHGVLPASSLLKMPRMLYGLEIVSSVPGRGVDERSDRNVKQSTTGLMLGVTRTSSPSQCTPKPPSLNKAARLQEGSPISSLARCLSQESTTD